MSTRSRYCSTSGSCSTPLRGKSTIEEVLAAVIFHDYDWRDLFGRAMRANVPAEYVHVIAKGLARDRSKRFQNVAELQRALRNARDGNTRVQCHITLGKHAIHATSHWIDRHALVYATLLAVAAVALCAVAALGVHALVIAILDTTSRV